MLYKMRDKDKEVKKSIEIQNKNKEENSFKVWYLIWYAKEYAWSSIRLSFFSK